MTASSARAPAGPLASPEPWDLVADEYAIEVVPMFEHFARAAIELARLPVPARVADVAAGPGTLSLLAAAMGAEVTAIDFAPAMIARLQQRAGAAGARIDARVGDGQALDLPDASCDGAFSMFGLIFFPDRAAGLGELRRVLRPGRRAVVSSWGPMPAPMAAMMTALRAHLPRMPARDDTAPLGDPASFTAELAAAGFTDIAIHPAVHVQQLPSSDALWDSAQRTMAPIALMKHRLGDAWGLVAAAVAEQLRAQLGAGPIELAMHAHLGVGVR